MSGSTSDEDRGARRRRLSTSAEARRPRLQRTREEEALLRRTRLLRG